jgi:hypothetical protein
MPFSAGAVLFHLRRLCVSLNTFSPSVYFFLFRYIMETRFIAHQTSGNLLLNSRQCSGCTSRAREILMIPENLQCSAKVNF